MAAQGPVGLDQDGSGVRDMLRVSTAVDATGLTGELPWGPRRTYVSEGFTPAASTFNST